MFEIKIEPTTMPDHFDQVTIKPSEKGPFKVVTSEGVSVDSFHDLDDAALFRDHFFFGYYRDCKIVIYSRNCTYDEVKVYDLVYVQGILMEVLKVWDYIDRDSVKVIRFTTKMTKYQPDPTNEIYRNTAFEGGPYGGRSDATISRVIK